MNEESEDDYFNLNLAICAVFDLHVAGPGHNPDCHCGIEPGAGARCKACNREYPCPTVTAVQDALKERP